MNIKALARWATLIATLAAPAVVSAQSANTDDQNKPTSGATANQGATTPDETTPSNKTDKTDKADRDKTQPMSGEQGAENAQPGMAGSAKLSENELQYVAHLHQVNQLEIDMGKLAEKKGSTTAIKDFGKTLVSDHQMMDKDAKDLVKSVGQKIPTGAKANVIAKNDLDKDKVAFKHLKKESGADFDRDFLAMAVQGHDRELALIDTQIGQVQSEHLKQFLNDTKVTLQKHADRARELQKNNAQAMR